MTDTPATPEVRMIPARALSLPELEEIVRALVESHNAQCKAAEDFILIFAGADDATAGA